jgi:ribonuclease BN (tRNA processing enzyme)
MPRPGGACSSYLVRTDGAALLLDLGSGAAGKLRESIEYRELDAIVISHMHADHFFDLVPLRYGLKFGGASSEDRVPLFLPPGGAKSLDALRNAVAPDSPVRFFDALFAVKEYDPSAELSIKNLRVSFAKTRHYIDAFAMRVEAGAASLTYSADTAPCNGVVELARKTSLFLCEAALGLGSEEGERGHSSAEEAGKMAQAASVKSLLLTHYPDGYSAHALVAAARSRFPGSVNAAEDGTEIAL